MTRLEREQKIFDKIVARAKARHPKLEFKPKGESGWMKFLNFFSQIFNDRFMTGYITVTMSTIYVPDRYMDHLSRLWGTTAHEWMHMEQSTRWGGRFFGQIFHTLGYIFPQWLAIFSLLAFLAIGFSNWWLMALLCLLFLAPIPAPFRMMKEFEAYMINNFIAYHEGYLSDAFVEARAKNFYKSSYYFMWPFKSWIIRRFHEENEKIKAGEYDDKLIFKDILEVLDEVDNGQQESAD